ncbi:MAG: patatin-like phospholipase family protein, partial [Clostridia bacterium]|nr:patatin-like phospholipase family protein [Clostridia bacterium]
MQKIFDSTKVYGVALGGGGAKGGYEVGVWQSLEEEGLVYNMISGTSVGALNGALMTMRDMDEAQRLWRDISYSKVMDVDDDSMSRIYSGDIKLKEYGSLIKRVVGVLRDGGFDVTPLRNLLNEHIDTARLKSSDVSFYAMTYSVTDKKGVEIDVRSLPEDEICDMLLASAYFPAFKHEPLVGGKRYTDGGVVDSLPVSSLISHGCKNIIAVRLTGGLGREKHVRIPKDTTVSYIEPTRKLGNTLNFSKEQAEYNIKLGYFD